MSIVERGVVRALRPSTVRLQRGWPIAGVIMIGLVMLSACSTAHSPNPFEGGRAATSEIQVVVESSTFNDATVWAISQSRQTRLGRVSGMASASFQLPWDGIEPLQLRVDLLAGQSYTTPSVMVSAGERVTLSLREPLSSSIISRGSR